MDTFVLNQIEQDSKTKITHSKPNDKPNDNVYRFTDHVTEAKVPLSQSTRASQRRLRAENAYSLGVLANNRNLNCFGDIKPTTYQRFLREYAETKNTGKFNWSELAYAVEMNYDQIALYCLDKLPLGNIDYTCFGTERRNLILTCVKNNKFNILKEIFDKYPDIKASGSQYVINQGKIGPARIQERQILHVAIERDNCLEWVKLLADFGADLNKNENHFVFPNGIGYKSYDRTPLQEAIFKNKLDVLEFLLERGVNPDTGLYTAVVTCRNVEALVLLLNYGADPYAYNGSILKEATELEDIEIVGILTGTCQSKIGRCSVD